MARVGPKSFLLFVLLALGGSPSQAQSPAKDPTALAPTESTARVVTYGQTPLELARQYYRSGRLDDAIAEYNKVIQADPDSALAYAGMVDVYLKQKKAKEAYDAAEKAAALAPTNDRVKVALGEVYFRQGKMADAEKLFTELIKAGTTEPRADLGLARVYRAEALYEHAKLAIDRAYELDPGDPDILKERAAYLSVAEQIKALRLFLAGGDDGEEQRRLRTALLTLQDQSERSGRSCRLVKNPGSTQTNLEPLMYDPKHIRGYGLRVGLNGTSSKLLLDTGASGIVVDRKIAEKAGIKPVAESQSSGIGDRGAVEAYIGYAESVKIGELEFHGCYVDVINQNSVAGQDGLIGANVFSSFLVDLDLPNAKMKLSPLPARPGQSDDAKPKPDESPAASPRFHDRYIAPEMRTFSPMFQFGHQLLLDTRVNDLPPKLFLVDTGAFANTISPAAAGEVTKVSANSNMKVKGISGEVKNVFRGDELTLHFASLRQKNQDIVAFDMTGISNSTGTEVSGLLGFSMLRILEIKIDYRDGLIDFEYNAKVSH